MISAGQASARAHEFWRKHSELRGFNSFQATFMKNLEDRQNEQQEKLIMLQDVVNSLEKKIMGMCTKKPGRPIGS